MPPNSTRTLIATCCRCRIRPQATKPWLGIAPGRSAQTVRYSTEPSPQSKIIVLDPPRRRSAEFDLPEPTMDPLDNQVLENVSKELLTYEREALMDRTRMEISEHKPPQPKVSARRYQQLLDQLMKCFNPIQLRSFYSHHRNEDQTIPRLRANNTKQKIVSAILNNVWKVEVAEDIAPREDYVVSKDIKCTSRDIFFLISDDGQQLRQWAGRASARIQVNVSTSSLTIQASEANIERIEVFMQNLLSTVTEEDLDLSVITRVAKFNDEFIAPISRNTKTYIVKRDENTLRISALDPAQDRLDDARRLLITSVNMEARAFSALLHANPVDSVSTGALYPVAEEAALPWMFRRHEWQRWRNLKTKREQKVAPVYGPPVLDTDSIHNVLHRIPESEGLKTMLASGKAGDGQPPMATTYHAKLGHILHHLNNAESRVPGSLADFVKAEKGRVFCSTFPGSPFFNKYLESGSQSEDAILNFGESFILKFIPSPWAEPTEFDKYPPVQITIPADVSSGQLSLPQIMAFNSTSVADVMLPNDRCDIRFERHEGMALAVNPMTTEPEGHFFGVDSEEWARYMKESRLDRNQDYRLRAAANIQIHIPLRLIEASKTIAAGVSGRARPVDYIFTSMEHRQTTSVTERGLTMSRSAIEGGSSGRTTEMRVSYSPQQQDSVSGREEFDSFFARSMNCITSLASWIKAPSH